MKNLSLITLALVIVFAVNAFSATSPKSSPTGGDVVPFPKDYSEIQPSYECFLQVFAEDYFEKAFVASGTGSHGGQELVFNFADHELTLLADQQWLAIHWTKSGKFIAQATTVVGQEGSDDRVRMIFDTETTDHYASVSCSRVKTGTL